MHKFTFNIIMKKSLIINCLFLCSLCAFAQQRSESEALQIAQEFFSKKGKPQRLSLVPPQKIETQMHKKIGSARKRASQRAGFYVVNEEKSRRFVIVSADERMYKVLGYSDNGMFNEEEAPCGLLTLLESYNTLYDSLVVCGNNIPKAEVKDSGLKKIGPLIESKWAQGSPYNDLCPIDVSKSETSRCVSGCVATAMAQVMNYYQYPSNCSGEYSYSTPFGLSLSLDFNTISFDWDQIQDTYNYYIDDSGLTTVPGRTDSEKAEVAKLLYACGVAVSMKYGVGSSGAYSLNIPYAMINYFKYNPNATLKDKAYYTNDEWDEMILNDLKAGHPILYTGANNYSDAHQFILDGCDEEGRYSFNFGWSGFSDGFYYLTGNNSIKYDWIQQMVCQVTPEEWGTYEDVFYTNSFSSDKLSTPVGGSVRFSFFPTCNSSSATVNEPNTGTFEGEIGIGLYDTDFNFIKPLCKQYFTGLNSGDIKYTQEEIVFDAANFLNGHSYLIAPYAKGKKAILPTRIRTLRGEQDYYLAIVKNNMVSLRIKGIEFTDVLTGSYTASAINKNGELEEWEVVLSKSSYNNMMYKISNFDPALNRLEEHKGYLANYVLGTISTDGTYLSVSANCYLGSDLNLISLSGNNTIIVHLNAKEKTMHIDDVWGTTQTSSNGGSTTVSEISRYSNTAFKFIEDESMPDMRIEAPIIEISSQNILSIISRTSGAAIYYTLDGKKPNSQSSMYINPVQLDRNCTIKAIAIKDNIESDVAIRELRDAFVVAKPHIISSDNIVSMSCSTEGANIFFTRDNSVPTSESEEYKGAFPCAENTIIKAFATRKDYLDSPVATYFFEYKPEPIPGPTPEPIPDPINLEVTNNIAGQLASNIPIEDRAAVISLTISGELNGTDIKLIREMSVSGSLANLNIQNTSIVRGGDVYYSNYGNDYNTENDILGNYMFAGCKSLINIKLPSTAKTLQGNCFNDCNNLREIVLPESCESVKDFAFDSCDNLESIKINKGLSSFGTMNGHRCPNLQAIYVDIDNPHYKSVDGVLFSHDGNKLLKFPMGKHIEEYSIPESTQEIGDYAFYYACAKKITIPNSVTTIGGSSFENCDYIENVIIPNSVKTIGPSAYNSCKNLTSVRCSSNIEEIPGHAFGFCVNLHEFTIGAKVRKIDEYAFSNCNSLQRIIVDEANETFCSLNGVIYTKDMTNLVLCPAALFTDEFRIPESVTTIVSKAFANCTNIKSFYIPQSVTTIGRYAFQNCMMSSITLPPTLTSLGEAAFQECNELETFVIPDNIKRIEDWLLYNCKKLNYLYIPAHINYIGLSAFRHCKSLKMINCKIHSYDDIVVKKASWDGMVSAFDGIPEDCCWRIPLDSEDNERIEEQYKKQSWWVPTWQIIYDTDVVQDPKPSIQQHHADWFTLHGSRLSGKPIQQGVYLHQGKKIYLK